MERLYAEPSEEMIYIAVCGILLGFGLSSNVRGSHCIKYSIQLLWKFDLDGKRFGLEVTV